MQQSNRRGADAPLPEGEATVVGGEAVTDPVPYERRHRDLAGCFHCLAVFRPRLITEWTDREEGIGQTALCPECGIDFGLTKVMMADEALARA